MFPFDRVIAFFRPRETERPMVDPTDIRTHVMHAYKLLCDANRKAIQVPADVVNVITAARRVTDGRLSEEHEAKFWNAFGLLSSSIRPAEKARRLYRFIFYVVLVSLLFGQFFFLAGDHVRGKLADLDKQTVDVRGRGATPPTATSVPTPRASVEQEILRIESERRAYKSLSKDLLAIAGTVVDLPLKPFGFKSFFSMDIPEGEAGEHIIKGKLEMLLVFLSSFLLPLAYGLLGACAYVLRKLSDEIEKLTYAHDARVRYSLRLNIGMLSGLAVGWFIKPGAGDAALVSLSPLALAFVAGYGSELFFVALDKLVQAFTPSSSAGGRIVQEQRSGGIITTKTQAHEARVAGKTANGAKGTRPTPDAASAKAEPPAGAGDAHSSWPPRTSSRVAERLGYTGALQSSPPLVAASDPARATAPDEVRDSVGSDATSSPSSSRSKARAT
jgi:hypothetical protein